MATAHLIHGIVGAGKTTLARRLEAETGAIRFTHDEWMRRLYGRDPPEATFVECFARVSGLMEEFWTRCLAASIDVVVDWGFWSRAERDRVRTVVRTAGGEYRLYRVACPDDVAWARIEARNAGSDPDLFIARDTFETLRRRVEPLEADEDRIEAAST